jgi:hypothetical protein
MPKPFRVRTALAAFAVLASTAVVAIATAPAAEAATVATLAPVVISTASSSVSCVVASTNGTTVTTEGCDPPIPVRMWWIPKPLPGGVQLTAAINPTRCLSVPNSSTSYNVRLVQEPCAAAARMLWTIHETSEITYEIVNVNSGHCAEKGDLGNYVVQGSCAYDWHITPVGTVKFRAQHSGKCLDVDDSGGVAVSGALAQQWTCLGAGATNQQYSLELRTLPHWSDTGCYGCGSVYMIPAHYRLVAIHSGMCLAHNNKYSNGTRVRQRPCDSQPDIWSLYPVDLSSGRQIFKIKQQLTNGPQQDTCVDVDNSDGGLDDGEKVQIYDCLDGQTNQLWSLFQVTEV